MSGDVDEKEGRKWRGKTVDVNLCDSGWRTSTVCARWSCEAFASDMWPASILARETLTSKLRSGRTGNTSFIVSGTNSKTRYAGCLPGVSAGETPG